MNSSEAPSCHYDEQLLNRDCRGYRGDRGGREGVPLMRHEYIWGMYTDEFEKPVQVGMFKAPQAYYKTIIPKNPKKGALTPGSIF